MTARRVPLGVLDLVPISHGSSPADALRHSIELAQTAERLGYRRTGSPSTTSTPGWPARRRRSSSRWSPVPPRPSVSDPAACRAGTGRLSRWSRSSVCWTPSTRAGSTSASAGRGSRFRPGAGGRRWGQAGRSGPSRHCGRSAHPRAPVDGRAARLAPVGPGRRAPPTGGGPVGRLPGPGGGRAPARRDLPLVGRARSPPGARAGRRRRGVDSREQRRPRARPWPASSAWPSQPTTT